MAIGIEDNSLNIEVESTAPEHGVLSTNLGIRAQFKVVTKGAIDSATINGDCKAK